MKECDLPEASKKLIGLIWNIIYVGTRTGADPLNTIDQILHLLRETQAKKPLPYHQANYQDHD